MRVPASSPACVRPSVPRRDLRQLRVPVALLRSGAGCSPHAVACPGPPGQGFPAMERALLPRLCRALRLCRAGLRFRSTRGAEEGAPRSRDPPASLPQGPEAGRGSRTGRELLRAQQDIPRAGKGKGPGRNALALERTKGSEILFGVAPCWLALARERRALFRLFLKEQRGGGSGRPLRAELALQAAARGVPVLHLPRRALDALCRGRPHQGVCLEAAPLPFRSLRDAEEPRQGDGESGRRQLLWLVLEHIQDPMNMGALLRAAYFLGVDRVVATHSNRYEPREQVRALPAPPFLPGRFPGCIAQLLFKEISGADPEQDLGCFCSAGRVWDVGFQAPPGLCLF